MKNRLVFMVLLLLLLSFSTPLFAVVYDDFNDNTVDMAKWFTGPPISSEITAIPFDEKNGILNFDGLSPKSQATLYSQTRLFGDFDVQIQWMDMKFVTGVNPVGMLGLAICGGANKFCMDVVVHTTNAEGVVTYGGNYHAENIGQILAEPVSVNAVSGYLRISRRGSVFTTYFSSNKLDWIPLLTFYHDITDVRFQIEGWKGNSTNPFHGAFDNIEYEGAPLCTNFTYSAWSACQPNGTQTRTVISSTPSGCTGTPILSQACIYPPPNSSSLFLSKIPTVPNGSITINGIADDWNGIQPMISDPQNDYYSTCEPATDVKSFFLAKDNTYLYWRVDTWNGNFILRASDDPRSLFVLFFDSNHKQRLSAAIHATYVVVAARYTVDQTWNGLYYGSDYGRVSAVAEGKIPLDAFSPLDIESVSIDYWRGPGLSCDNTSRFPSTCNYIYSPWSSCQPDGTQSRTVQSSNPAECSGTPILTQACTPTPPNSVWGKIVILHSNEAISGARIELVGDPSKFTTSESDGSYILSGLPFGSPFSLKFTHADYVPEYSSNASPIPNPSLSPFGLATNDNLATWGIETGKSAIIGRVRDSSTNPLSGAIVTCISNLHKDVCPYSIVYSNSETTTFSDGQYLIKNVLPGDIVTVSASKPGLDFARREFTIHADGISFGHVNQISPADPTLTVNKFGTGNGSIITIIGTETGTLSWVGNVGTASYNSGTVITLTAIPDAGSIFTSWSGGCDISSGDKCIIMKTGARTVTATFDHVNRAPIFNPIAPIPAFPAQLVQFSVIATDPDGDNITYYTEPLPLGASFDPSTRLFSWTPEYNQTGTHTIRFFAEDNGSPDHKVGDTYVIVSVNVPTPDVLINQITDTVYILNLEKEVENSYIANLKKVGDFIQNGKLIPALNQLSATIEKIKTDMAKGSISEANGNKLIIMITLLMNEMNS